MVLTQSQRDVFKLYRQGLRAIRAKPEVNQPYFLLYLRHAFRSPSGGGGLRKRDFAAIEYMLRRGKRMIEDIFEEKGVKKINPPAGSIEWWEAEVEKGRTGGGRVAEVEEEEVESPTQGKGHETGHHT